MSEQHTPGPLKNVKHSIYSDAGYSIALTLLTRSSLGEEHDEANARRLVACWNASEGIDTEDLEAGSVNIIDKLHDDAARRVMAQRDELLAALKEAATSLETISILSGRKTFGQPPIETYMEDFMQVRGYANSRMTVARAAIAKVEGGAA